MLMQSATVVDKCLLLDDSVQTRETQNRGRLVSTAHTPVISMVSLD